MAYEQKENSGNLFRVAERKSEKHPEYEGDFSSTCPHCNKPSGGWVKAWVRETKSGTKFFSLAFKFKQRSGN